MMNKSDVKIGQSIYFQEHWTGMIIKGKIYEINDEGVLVHGECYVRPDGRPDDKFYGSTGGQWENIYPTAKAAYEGKRAKHNAKIAKYCEEITDINALVEFPLKHPFGAEEYTNYEAIEAYKIRCKELMNLDFSSL